mgnify:CR=1 FL=1
MGPFFFWFQRGLADATTLRRLVKCPKSVSERHLSLTERPSASEGRFQKVSNFQCVAVFGRAPFSKVQPIAQFYANPEDGRFCRIPS